MGRGTCVFASLRAERAVFETRKGCSRGNAAEHVQLPVKAVYKVEEQHCLSEMMGNGQEGYWAVKAEPPSPPSMHQPFFSEAFLRVTMAFLCSRSTLILSHRMKLHLTSAVRGRKNVLISLRVLQS